MKTNFVLLTFLCLFQGLTAQNSAYFQQEVNYRITVSLDDQKHRLAGKLDIEYINNSPDALNEIQMHLWGNAYKNQQTEFARQQIRNGSKKFFYAKVEDKGYFSELDFSANDSKARWEIDKKHPDIAIIHLERPLKSGEKIKISTPFKLKIPASFSRLGHIDQSYQITQWYPKPAVYDNRGWHAMPYLNQGEFYSEFGSFDVSITLPENYVVGATGVLQEESEIAFLESRIRETKIALDTVGSKNSGQQPFPVSSLNTKTIRYLAKNVHDFAWFADKRFFVTKDIATLPSGAKVDCYAMFTEFQKDLWTKAAFYVKRSVEYYSQRVGEYPYPHATAVQSALSAGGGMEYPMITVIDKAGGAKGLDIVIAHEVGHNWFYGILASNEREHPWMDEGMNSYYEEAYNREYYPPNESEKPKKKGLNFSITADSGIENLAYRWMAIQELDQPCELHAADYVGLNYGLIVYKKTAKNMALLEQYVGTDKFNQVMKKYFMLWKFKHPYPEDFRKLWENEVKDLNLSWFFDDLIQTTGKTEVSIKPAKRLHSSEEGIPLTLRLQGDPVPVPICGVKNNRVVISKVFELPASKKSTQILFPAGDYDKIVADYNMMLPSKTRSVELNGKGNLPSKYYLPKVKAINLLENPNRPLTAGLLPAFSYNHYDRGQLGALIYTPLIPRSANSYTYLMPLYSFEQKQWNGTFGINQAFYFKKRKIHKIEAQVGFRSFSYNNDERYNANSRYFRFQNSISIDLKKKHATDSKSRNITARMVSVTEQEPIGTEINEKKYRDTSRSYNIAELKYTYRDRNILKPTNWTVTAQYGTGFAKVFTAFNQKILLEHKNEAIHLRAFAGSFLSYDNPIPNVSLRSSGRPGPFNTDYMYDQLLVARSSGNPRFYYPPVGNKVDLRPNSGGTFFSQQLFIQDGGLKTLGAGLISNSWIASAGIGYDLPLSLPFRVRPYFDFAVAPSSNKLATVWSAGIGAIIVPEIFEIYFPIPYRDTNGWRTLESNNIYYDKRTSYAQKISFVLNINKLNPFEALRNVQLNF